MRSLHCRRIEPDETRRLIEKYEHIFPVTVRTYFMEYIRSIKIKKNSDSEVTIQMEDKIKN